MTIWNYSDCPANISRKVISEPSCVFCNSNMHELKQRTVEYVEDNIDESTHVAVCPICGWWKILRLEEEINGTGYFEPAPEEPWEDGSYRKNGIWGAYGSLKELDLVDIDLPIEDVRAYLVGRYEKRFELHPRLFEQTVASVFEDLGYVSRVTAYTNDGGIDVILEGGTIKLVVV